jgi:hypothetical protein
VHVMQQRMLQDSISSSYSPSEASGSLCSSSSSVGVAVLRQHVDACADVFVAFLGEHARSRVRSCSA